MAWTDAVGCREVIPDGDQAGHAVEPFLFRRLVFL
jgi:hypothetical protein